MLKNIFKIKGPSLWGPFIGPAIGPIISGLLLTASFPDISFSFAAWFAFVPLLYSIKDKNIPKSFRAGFIAGLVHYITLIYWIVYTMQTYGRLPAFISYPVFFLFACYLALYIGSLCAALSWLAKKASSALFIFPLLIVCLEYIRTFLLTGFPWGLLGYTQYKHTSIIQIADIFGVYGVSFLIGGSNIVLFVILLYAFKKGWQKSSVSKTSVSAAVCILVALICFALIYGAVRTKSLAQTIASDKTAKAKISVVQGNVDQSIKWDNVFQNAILEKYNRLSSIAAEQNPKLIVWPETATSFYYLSDPKLTQKLNQMIKETDTYFLIGSPSYIITNETAALFNSAYLIDNTAKTIGKYDKFHLVPFGEYVPLKKWLPFIGKITQEVGEFTSGQKGDILDILGPAPFKIGALICYEIIFPDLARQMTENGASIIVNITNDAWFGKTSAAMQHFSMSVFRAIENKRAVVRAANTGISGFIDPLGNIIAKSEIFCETTITKELPLIHQKTLYTKIGGIFTGICLVITLSLIFSKLAAKRRSS